MSPVALITGGAVRLGRALTLGFAGAGYHVVVNYHSSEGPAREVEALLRDQGRDALLAQGDVSDQDAITRVAS